MSYERPEQFFLEFLGTVGDVFGENTARIGFPLMTFYFLKSLEDCKRFLNLLKEITMPGISEASGGMYHE